eukprot:232346-Lingulodinium_polyedra.AAC.1
MNGCRRQRWRNANDVARANAMSGLPAFSAKGPRRVPNPTTAAPRHACGQTRVPSQCTTCT